MPVSSSAPRTSDSASDSEGGTGEREDIEDKSEEDMSPAILAFLCAALLQFDSQGEVSVAAGRVKGEVRVMGRTKC